MHVVCGHFGCKDPLFQTLQVQVTDWNSEVINEAGDGKVNALRRRSVGQ
jgi:hypothetical protein